EPIAYAMPDFAGGAAVIGGLLDQQQRSARTQLRRLEERYAKRRITLRALLQTGSGHPAIADTAKQTKADLIVMATHGRTGLSHLLLGSVAERVVRAATCPVLTLHPGRGRRRTSTRKRTARAKRR